MVPTLSAQAMNAYVINLYHIVGYFTRRQIGDVFLTFSRKQAYDLIFPGNCVKRRQFA